ASRNRAHHTSWRRDGSDRMPTVRLLSSTRLTQEPQVRWPEDDSGSHSWTPADLGTGHIVSQPLNFARGHSSASFFALAACAAVPWRLTTARVMRKFRLSGGISGSATAGCAK